MSLLSIYFMAGGLFFAAAVCSRLYYDNTHRHRPGGFGFIWRVCAVFFAWPVFALWALYDGALVLYRWWREDNV